MIVGEFAPNALKQLLQLPFTHYESLAIACDEDDAAKAIEVSNLGEALYAKMASLYKDCKGKHELQIVIFAFITEIAVINTDLSVTGFLTEVIHNLAKPNMYPQSVGKQYFELLSSMIERSPVRLSREVGHEFFLNLGCSPKCQQFEKGLKRLIVSYK